MSLERPTPRTDAHAKKMHRYEFDEELAMTYQHARGLELEVEDAKQLNRELLDKLEAMQAERDLARQRGFEMADVLEKTELERDEANEHAAQLEASLLTMTKAATMIVEAYSPQFFRAGKWAQGALDACRDTLVTDISGKLAETFEAHGHTWTRHTPGDPCPVPPNAMVHFLMKDDTANAARVFVPAGEVRWTDTNSRADVIGWRYAEKSLPPQLVVLPTAAECGQYADKHLAPPEKPQPDNEPEPS